MAVRKELFPAIMAMVSVSVAIAGDIAISGEVGHGCSPWKYVNSSAFEANQAAVFKSLGSNLSGFATSISNIYKTDPVFGLVQCMNYLTTDQCIDCYKLAKDKLKQYCTGYDGGRIQLDGCFLRYENNTFFDQSVSDFSLILCSSVIDGQPGEFSDKAGALLTQVMTNASQGDGYAVASVAAGTGFIYALAQCWKSLVDASCEQCLGYARKQLVQECLPQRRGRSVPAGCFMSYANYSFFSKDQNSSLPNSGAPSSNWQTKKLPILLGSIGGAAFITALFVVIVFKCSLRKFKGFVVRLGLGQSYGKTDGDLVAERKFGLEFFDYEVLRYATGNFDGRNLLGKGAFGEVYKGTLDDGTNIAVKKLKGNNSTDQAMDEFLTEVELIGSVRHRNLVRLLGCCMSGHDRLLVYDYMSNNSLDKHLFGDAKNHLDWDTRFNIILGTARGLAYLHEDSNVRVIHRDIKCANILLDDKFQPRIADFGLAKFFPEGETHVSTRIGGTIGYTAPEYAVHGQLTEKADVYSYGVVVLEIVSGRKCMDPKLPEPQQLLLEWCWRLYESEQVLEIVDPGLRGEYGKERMLKVITIALLCTQASPTLRPAMSQVMSMLMNESEIGVLPTQPAFIDSNVKASTPTSSSMSAASISQSLLPR